MTDKDIQKIAEAVVDLIIKKQKLNDEEFKKDLENMLEGQDDVTLGSMSETDFIEEEIYKLEKALKKHVENEEYDKAEKINQKIINLRNKYEL
jgi:protein-arginine kinase activator protein McsA